MKLTDEQREAVTCDENTLLEACPGSGKTRTIVAKALRCLDGVRETPRKIAIITYTNGAVHEIESRLRIYGATGDLDCCEVSTIHSFCLNNILSGFYWRVTDYEDGFTILPSDSEQYQEIVMRICDRHHLHRLAREQFPLLNRDAHGEPILGNSSAITAVAAHEFWQELSNIDAVDFSTIVYLTYLLVKRFPSLAYALSCRFQWILVDELQDTTELQVEILKLIFKAGRSRFFLVGDPHQSIFGFAGARPALITAFSSHVKARADFRLWQNWRSNPQIIAHAELLLPRKTKMKSAGAIANDTCEPKYIHVNNPFEALEDYFLPALTELGIAYGDAAILAPSWFTLLPIGRRLREYGVPIIGPGARPYKGSHTFARLAEYICEYIVRPSPMLIRNIERELHRVVFEASRVYRFDIFGYSGRVLIFRLLQIGARLNREGESAELWLTRAADEFSRLLVEADVLPVAAINILRESAAAMCGQMRENEQVDLENMTVSDLGLFAATSRSVRLLTMHASKGLEFEAVALFGLHDGQIPNRRAQTTEEIAEYRRLFYVAITRAKRFLLYVTDQSSDRNVPSRFLGRDGLNLT